MDYISELEGIEKKVNDKKIEKARLEERQKGLEEEKKVVEQKLAEIVPAGVSPEDWIKTESEEIEKEILKCQEILKTA